MQFLHSKGQKLYFRGTSNLKVNPATNQEEITKQINKSVRTAKIYMAEIQEKGLISRKIVKNGK